MKRKKKELPKPIARRKACGRCICGMVFVVRDGVRRMRPCDCQTGPPPAPAVIDSKTAGAGQ